MNASRFIEEKEVRRTSRNRRREREDFTVQPSARKPNTRAVYSDPVPVEKAEPVIRAIDSMRVIGVVDQYNPSGSGFLVVPELDCEVIFFHVRDCNFDEQMLVPGLTIECAAEESKPRIGFNGKPRRRIARNIKLAPPITTEIEATIVRAEVNGNAWLVVNGQRAYFRSYDVAVGDRVSALIYDGPKGLRATRVEKIV